MNVTLLVFLLENLCAASVFYAMTLMLVSVIQLLCCLISLNTINLFFVCSAANAWIQNGYYWQFSCMFPCSVNVTGVSRRSLFWRIGTVPVEGIACFPNENQSAPARGCWGMDGYRPVGLL